MNLRIDNNIYTIGHFHIICDDCNKDARLNIKLKELNGVNYYKINITCRYCNNAEIIAELDK